MTTERARLAVSAETVARGAVYSLEPPLHSRIPDPDSDAGGPNHRQVRDMVRMHPDDSVLRLHFFDKGYRRARTI